VIIVAARFRVAESVVQLPYGAKEAPLFACHPMSLVLLCCFPDAPGSGIHPRSSRRFSHKFY
jgi:hypothetical protein